MLPRISSRLFGFALAASMLALAACGGGGGGGSTPPVQNPGGGGGGTPPSSAPTSAPSGAPTGSPTSGPTSHPTQGPTQSPTQSPTQTPTQTPTATPPPTAQSITMLPDTSGRFSMMQINDSDGVRPGMTTSQIQTEAPHYDAVWGAFSPSTWSGAHPGMYVSRYYLPNEDAKQISGHDLAWFQNNHPDWILYACDSNGNPTHDMAYFFTGFGDVPLNIHNPDVVNYQIGEIASYLKANGYNSLAVDNVEFINYSAGPNPEFGEGSVQSGWYGCGVYVNGQFQRIYTTGRGKADPVWTADTLNWLSSVRNAINTNPQLSNVKLLINHPPYDAQPDADETQMLGYVDGMLDENGFTHYGSLYTGNQFMNTLNWMEYAQSHNKAIFITDYYCSGTCSTDPNSLTPQQMDWALASYALGNNGGAGLFVSPKGGAIYTYRSEYSATYGKPCGGYARNNNLLYRQFAGGFAVVNDGASAQSITLPAGHTYTDIEGRAVTNPLTVGASDAYMLLTGGNGCS